MFLIHFLLPPECPCNRVDVVDALLAPGIGLHMTRSISIKQQVRRLTVGIRIPRNGLVQNTRVWIQVMNERCPHVRHHGTEINI